MSMKKLWLVPAALVIGVATAAPDTVYLQDGRRLRGDVVSMNQNGIVVFNQDEDGFFGSSNARNRRVRLNRNDIVRIDFTDSDDGFFGDDDLITPGSGSFGSGRDILVRADQPWTDTGIRVRAGDVFRIDATGMIHWGPSRSDDPNGEVSSPYNANRPLPNRAGGALIGRIGNGEPFLVGSGMQSFRAGTSGNLYLGVNDDYLRDNSGSFRVVVSPR
jgi:hypothetical protein